MAEISRADLFAKLTPLAFKSLESATMFCKLRGHLNVELAHWLIQILQLQDSDLLRLIRAFELSESRVSSDLTDALECLPRGGSGMTDLSAYLEESVERGWLYASLLFQCQQVRTGHLLVAILKTPALRKQLVGLSAEFAKFKLERLTDDFDSLLNGSPETPNRIAAEQVSPNKAHGAETPAVMGGNAGLSRFTTDLTAAAREGRLDPVVGRNAEIRQVVDILMRRRQNNPILTGEAGVGKTAVVEGLALRIAVGDVPPALRNVRLLSLDVGLLQAGASMKGEFEQRLRQVIDEVQASTTPIILFIDEAHSLLGGGGQGGTADAANLLKPALARGNLRTIAATTWCEYKKYIEKDPALTRRFQVVKVEQPETASAINMLRHLTDVLEQHHCVRILDEAVCAAVELSSRYIPDRQLPDKAISLLDTAAARVAVSQHAVPADVDDCRKQIESLQVEADIVRREFASDASRLHELSSLEAGMVTMRETLASLESRWEQERQLVHTILDMKQELSTSIEQATGDKSYSAREGHLNPSSVHACTEQIGQPTERKSIRNLVEHENAWGSLINTFATDGEDFPTSTLDDSKTPETTSNGTDDASTDERPRRVDVEQMQERLSDLQLQLRECQGESPLVLAVVDQQAVASVVADWTGIPMGRMLAGQIDSVLGLEHTLAERVVGQDHAMRALARRIHTSRAGLDDPEKPVGVFLLAGPSGVGKTETAIALAELLFGGQQHLITINMSEFQESHSVSTLKGAPPGYVGYGEGGVLTEAVRRKPYSVVLLDEIEKAHPDTHEVFFQVFDKGHMEDGEGRSINFKNALILMTSNVGSETISRLNRQGEQRADIEAVGAAIRPDLLQIFPPALLGRMVVVPYYPLDDANLIKIIGLKVAKVVRRVRDTYAAQLDVQKPVLELIRRRCTEVESGGRMIDAILTNTLLPEISQRILSNLSSRKTCSKICLSMVDEQIHYELS